MSDDPRFLTTRWSIVRAAQGEDPQARQALELLCKDYWYPLYAFVRRSGLQADEAEDIVQAFFARLIERRDLDVLSPDAGRFRSFLRVAVRNFMINKLAHDRAAKRGGGRAPLSLDPGQADERWRGEASLAEDPERAFEQAWARELLRMAVEDLRREYAESGRGRLFEELRDELQRPGDSECAAAAERLGISTGACRVALHRLRSRFRERLQSRIQSTLGPDEDWQDELSALLRALAG
ncbi:MAG: RNA polymerase sigma factor [Planctomycetia bacterium]